MRLLRWIAPALLPLAAAACGTNPCQKLSAKCVKCPTQAEQASCQLLADADTTPPSACQKALDAGTYKDCK